MALKQLSKSEKMIVSILAILSVIVIIQGWMLYSVTSATNRRFDDAATQSLKNHMEFLQFKHEYEQAHPAHAN